jgi:hypothetical protein
LIVDRCVFPGVGEIALCSVQLVFSVPAGAGVGYHCLIASWTFALAGRETVCLEDEVEDPGRPLPALGRTPMVGQERLSLLDAVVLNVRSGFWIRKNGGGSL